MNSKSLVVIADQLMADEVLLLIYKQPGYIVHTELLALLWTKPLAFPNCYSLLTEGRDLPGPNVIV